MVVNQKNFVGEKTTFKPNRDIDEIEVVYVHSIIKNSKIAKVTSAIQTSFAIVHLHGKHIVGRADYNWI